MAKKHGVKSAETGEVEYMELRKIMNRYDAIKRLAEIQGFDMEDDEGKENTTAIRDALKSLRFKKLSDMVGFFEAISEEWPAERDLPDTPFTAEGELRAGWRVKEINVLIVEGGRRSDATAKAFVRENYALVDIKEWKEIA